MKLGLFVNEEPMALTELSASANHVLDTEIPP